MYGRELTTFTVTAEQGSFLKASKALYTTPASVMNQINKLEEQVGVSLFARTSQGVRLTAAGRSFYEDAKNIIRLSEQAAVRARLAADDTQRVIVVGTSILRPCGALVKLCSGLDDGSFPFSFRLVPFDDSPGGMEDMLESLGGDIDCFVGPCDSADWKERFNIFPLKPVDCCVAVPRKHALARRKRLSWRDLDGETFMLVRRGESPVLDSLRDEIESEHPEIALCDAPHFYDVSVFNDCVRRGCLMETLDIWKDVHPDMVTLPMDWKYVMPHGIVYAKNPSDSMRALVAMLSRRLISEKTE